MDELGWLGRIKAMVEKAATGLSRNMWWAVPGWGILTALDWFLTEYIPQRAQGWLESIAGSIGDGVGQLNLSVVGLDWARINQFIPLTETIAMAGQYLAFVGLMWVFKILKKLIPFVG